MITPLIDWDLFSVYTDSGTLLSRASVEQALLDFDLWAFYERTDMNMPRGQRDFMVSWKSVLEKLQMPFSEVNRKKLFSELEKDLDGWSKKQESKKTASTAVTLDAAQVKTITTGLQRVFSARAKDTNEIGLDAAAVYYQVMTETAEDLETIKNNIRSLCLQVPDHFAINSGPVGKVRRLQDSKGKTTGQTVFPPRAKRGSKKNGSAE